MNYNTLIYEVKNEKIAVITLNRPEYYNAVNREMAQEIVEALQQAEEDDNIKVLVITGAGKIFCAGGDVSWLMKADDNFKKREIMECASKFINKLNNLQKPVIAGVNGTAAGAGTAVILACDIIIASEKAQFAPNFINIGAVPDSGASWYLPRKIGYHKAMELMLTGKQIDAQEAYSLGIYNHITREDEFQDKLFDLAKIISSKPHNAACYIKQMLKAGLENSLNNQLEIEASLQLMALSDQDFQEGINAFLEKRKPNFK